MTKETKNEIMNKTTYDLNEAKDRMYQGVQTLEDNGMIRDAETLMRMIYKLEAFQNKYE